jgi:hypothetical protein
MELREMASIHRSGADDLADFRRATRHDWVGFATPAGKGARFTAHDAGKVQIAGATGSSSRQPSCGWLTGKG